MTSIYRMDTNLDCELILSLSLASKLKITIYHRIKNKIVLNQWKTNYVTPCVFVAISKLGYTPTTQRFLSWHFKHEDISLCFLSFCLKLQTDMLPQNTPLCNCNKKHFILMTNLWEKQRYMFFHWYTYCCIPVFFIKTLFHMRMLVRSSLKFSSLFINMIFIKYFLWKIKTLKQNWQPLYF